MAIKSKNKNPEKPKNKELKRSKSKKVFGGVFGGIGEYLGFEVTVLRAIPFLLTLIAYLFFGINWAAVFVVVVALLYLITWVMIPEE